MDGNLGEWGRESVRQLLPEMAITAAFAHEAEYTVAAVRIEPGSTAVKAATYLAVWDDGRPYASEVGVVRAFTYNPHTRTQGAQPGWVAKGVLELYKGTLSVLSVDLRIDFTGISSNSSPWASGTSGIEGNLVMAELPHVASEG